ncbi:MULTISPECIES: ammonium transporter [Maritimibacter]|uniref:Ammonium transporter n=1 Tax=Maritimibacter alkaliphilus HTCC2654 TaxID=314271 RepID=A3VF43_9RHOB|nr:MULTISPECIES: ammonium transporter [Maritimibacter]EAQ12958.1 ammonium transporter [Rhodobacterales bacterium HTCC2654] [Maritimibacter alkaliphilus HTCC2654]TYP85050.1 Amt family ammonium transporter [Maritimibacter alkaliphilus HTCC2654]
MQLKKLLPLGVAAATLLPMVAFGQDEGPAAGTDASSDSIFIFNSLLFLIGGFLVMWMAAGFSMLEAGLVRSKNVTMQLTKNIALFSLAAIMYYLIGYNLMYPLGNWSIGTDETGGYLGAFGVAVLEAVGVGRDAADDYGYASTGSDFFFQLMFCATTASIVSGTLAERIKLWPFLIFTIILTGFIYPIQASWKWGGGFLDSQFGFLDFAGSTVVHSVGGWAALAGALILGPRLGKYVDGKVTAFPGSNLTLATLGTFILWLGWFGFNGGSQLAMGTVGDVADVSRIFSNTNTAAAGGAIAALILTQIVYKKVDLTMVLNGALAGLVSITAEPLTPSLGAATIIGAIGGVIVVFTVPLLDKLKIDDVVGAIPVHLFAGIWGTIAVIFTNSDATFGGQIISIIIVGIFAFVVSAIIWFILKAIMGLRVSEEDEMMGLDKAELGMEAYPEFTS